MNAVNAVHSNYINQYQTAELNSTTQFNSEDDKKNLEKSVYDRANVKDSVEIASEAEASAYARTTKGLSSEQINSMRDQMRSVELDMVRKMIESVNNSMKSSLGTLFGKNSSVKISTGAVLTPDDFALPAMPTTQADAKAALEDGGAWSVDATASRIVNLSVKIANGDVAMLDKMRDAFLKGYKA
ncbi:MAG: hypothetical protein J1F64_06350, partial [Oscillospiraceae bacterium]|nr:hypothetical protein [Oscillospiraceae bacterium]